MHSLKILILVLLTFLCLFFLLTFDLLIKPLNILHTSIFINFAHTPRNFVKINLRKLTLNLLVEILLVFKVILPLNFLNFRFRYSYFLYIFQFFNHFIHLSCNLLSILFTQNLQLVPFTAYIDKIIIGNIPIRQYLISPHSTLSLRKRREILTMHASCIHFSLQIITSQILRRTSMDSGIKSRNTTINSR